MNTRNQYSSLFRVLLLSLTFVLTSCSIFYSEPPRSGPHMVPELKGKTHEEKVDMQQEIIEQQEKEIERQTEEIKHLRRQQFHNQRMIDRYGS